MAQPTRKSFLGFSQLFVDINYSDESHTECFSDSFLMPELQEDEKIAITVAKNCMGASVSWKFNNLHEHKFVINKHIQPHAAQKQQQEEDNTINWGKESQIQYGRIGSTSLTGELMSTTQHFTVPGGEIEFRAFLTLTTPGVKPYNFDTRVSPLGIASQTWNTPFGYLGFNDTSMTAGAKLNKHFSVYTGFAIDGAYILGIKEPIEKGLTLQYEFRYKVKPNTSFRFPKEQTDDQKSPQTEYNSIYQNHFDHETAKRVIEVVAGGLFLFAVIAVFVSVSVATFGGVDVAAGTALASGATVMVISH